MNKRILAVVWLAFFSAASSEATPITYKAALTGLAEAPPNASPGTGAAMVIFDDVAHTLSVDLTFSGLTGNTTASHIHCCTAIPEAGTAGVATPTPYFPGFPVGVTSGSYTNVFDLAQAASWNASFITNNGGTPASAEAVLGAGLAAGRAYLNVHSTTFPGGEIRGFLKPVPEPATVLLLGVGVAGLLLRKKRC